MKFSEVDGHFNSFSPAPATNSSLWEGWTLVESPGSGPRAHLPRQVALAGARWEHMAGKQQSTACLTAAGTRSGGGDRAHRKQYWVGWWWLCFSINYRLERIMHL